MKTTDKLIVYWSTSLALIISNTFQCKFLLKYLSYHPYKIKVINELLKKKKLYIVPSRILLQVI